MQPSYYRIAKAIYSSKEVQYRFGTCYTCFTAGVVFLIHCYISLGAVVVSRPCAIIVKIGRASCRERV